MAARNGGLIGWVVMSSSTLIGHQLATHELPQGGEERKEESLSLSPAGSGGLSKDGDGCRIASKDVDVALDPLQRQPLVVIPGGERNSQCR
jgi:hypothetical protein